MTKEKTCCLCGVTYTAYGNNPEPFGKGEDRCCDDCNDFYVVPARCVLGRSGDQIGRDAVLRIIAKMASFSQIRRGWYKPAA
jgi:hypothetical protein